MSFSSLPIWKGPAGTRQNSIPSTVTSGRGSPRSASTCPAAARSRAGIASLRKAVTRACEEAGREPVNRLELPAADGSVIFTIELATIDYPAYRASLRDGSGKELWQSRGLQPDSRDTLAILLPSTMLAPGVYELTIEGEGKGVVVGTYPFRVVRP